MGVPPGPPPGGYYGGQPPPGFHGGPPPRPAPNSGGVWKALGIGCAAVFLLLLIGGIVAVRSVKNQIDHPSKNSFAGLMVTAGKAGLDGVLIQQSIVQYHQKNGRYPASLMALVQDGELDGKRLHNDLDDSPDPAHLSWRYEKPEEGAPGNTPILEEAYHVTIAGSPPQPGRIVITLDGRNQANGNVPSSQPPSQSQP